jgi:two-component system, NarL family, response regulator LiaR
MVMDRIRVVVADDHPAMRAGLREALHRTDDIVVVGEAATGEEALRQAADTAADVLLIDMVLPDITGVEVVRRLREAAPQTRVVILSAYSKADFVLHAFATGATGHPIMDAKINQVVEAARAASPGVARLGKPALPTITQQRMLIGNGIAELTPSEAKVVALVARFRTNQEIASALVISVKTVEYHVSNILAKLGVTSRREAARWAWASTGQTDGVVDSYHERPIINASPVGCVGRWETSSPRL